MPKPSKAEIALVQILDGHWAVEEVEYFTGMPRDQAAKVMEIRDELARKYPGIYSMKVSEPDV